MQRAGGRFKWWTGMLVLLMFACGCLPSPTDDSQADSQTIDSQNGDTQNSDTQNSDTEDVQNVSPDTATGEDCTSTKFFLSGSVTSVHDNSNNIPDGVEIGYGDHNSIMDGKCLSLLYPDSLLLVDPLNLKQLTEAKVMQDCGVLIAGQVNGTYTVNTDFPAPGDVPMLLLFDTKPKATYVPTINLLPQIHRGPLCEIVDGEAVILEHAKVAQGLVGSSQLKNLLDKTYQRGFMIAIVLKDSLGTGEILEAVSGVTLKKASSANSLISFPITSADPFVLGTEGGKTNDLGMILLFRKTGSIAGGWDDDYFIDRDGKAVSGHQWGGTNNGAIVITFFLVD